MEVSFIRFAHDWEVDVVIAFFGVLYSHRWRQGDEDCVWWVPSKRKKFEVMSFSHEFLVVFFFFFFFFFFFYGGSW
jgi:hypothetical protein